MEALLIASAEMQGGSRAWRPTGRPDEEKAPVAALLKLSHEAVDNVGLGSDNVQGVHVGLGSAAVLEALNVWRT